VDGVAYFDGVVDIDNAGATMTTTSGLIDLALTAGDSGGVSPVTAMQIVVSQADGVPLGRYARGMYIELSANDADGVMYGATIRSMNTANAGAGSYDALLQLRNAEPTVSAVTDALVVTDTGNTDGSIVDAIDASDTEITNALNAAQNFIVFDTTRQFGSAAGTITWEDTSGNDLMTLTDNTNVGDLVLSGDLAVNGDDITSDGVLTVLANTYTRIGDVSTPGDASTDDDLYMSGALEVDGTSYFDGVVDLDVAGSSTTTTTGILEMDVSAGNAAVDAVNVALTQANGAATGTEATGLDVMLDAEDLDGNLIGINITNQAGVTNGVAGNYEAFLRVINTEGLANIVTDAVLIQDSGNVTGSIVDAIDVADDEITNAINVGANIILGTDAVINFTGFDVAATTGATVIAGSADGTDALTLTTGDIAVSNGDLDVAGGDFNVTLDAGDTINLANSGDTTTTGALAISHTTAATNVGSTTGMSLNSTLTNYADDGDIDFRTGFDLTVTNNATDAVINDTVAGIRINDLAGTNNLNGRESALEIVGTSWDFNMYFNDAVALIGLQDAGQLIWVDVSLGASNTLMTLTDAGTSGNLTVTGTVTLDLDTTASQEQAVCHPDGDTTDVLLGDCDGAPTSDYAEQYPTAENVSYGDIVVPGTKIVTTQDDRQGIQQITQVVLSSRPYQGPVVGIVSNNYGDFTSAGYNVPEEEHPMPVALVGRVPVNVTNENGSIRVGDYLTTSSTPGYAMKATEVGRVIGMALADFNGTTGQVMAQVNNGWYMGDIIASDGASTIVTDKAVMAPLSNATTSQPSVDSFGLALRGSAWDGMQAQAVEMMLKTSVDDVNNFRLSIRNTIDTEVAYITNEGNMKIAGDLVIGGHFYPSDRGVPQTSKEIYYDGSSGAGGDFMRTDAAGWSTGSYGFAEMFPSDETLQSGEVVVFADSDQKVHRSMEASSIRIAGIVSTRPGFLAGENTIGSHPIALVGRVPTRVTDENGEVKIGDPLTTSSKPGYAMKATSAGMIVGYALEPLVSGSSSILVFVNVGHWGGEAISNIPGTNNQASGFGSGTNVNYSALNMTGNIYVSGNEILSVGRIAGISDIWSIEQDGTIKTEGLLKVVTRSYTDEKVETLAVTSPESAITLTGTSKLSGTQAEVRFEDYSAEFNDVTSADAPLRVIVTPSGPVSLYVFEKDNNHFVVKQFAGEMEDIEFDWIVIAYRKGYEPVEEEEEGSSESSGQWTVDSGQEEPVIASASQSVSDDWSQTQPSEAISASEPADPVSQDTNLIDSLTEDEGGTQAEQPSELEVESATDTNEILSDEALSSVQEGVTE
jgi:hypothetical protein